MEEPRANVDQPAPFSAVLLSGGKSSRMGFDKATFQIDGEPLWQRQIKILQSIGAAKVFISGAIVGPWHGSGITVLEDEISGLGPMGALAGILENISTDLVLVLAVDMPAMTVEFLTNLLARDAAVVPKNGEYYEPLAAVYAKSSLSLVRSFLDRGQRSLQVFLREAVAQKTMKVHPVSFAEAAFFSNLNELPAPV